jgi:hypothetical protein
MAIVVNVIMLVARVVSVRVWAKVADLSISTVIRFTSVISRTEYEPDSTCADDCGRRHARID